MARPPLTDHHSSSPRRVTSSRFLDGLVLTSPSVRHDACQSHGAFGTRRTGLPITRAVHAVRSLGRTPPGTPVMSYETYDQQSATHVWSSRISTVSLTQAPLC